MPELTQPPRPTEGGAAGTRAPSGERSGAGAPPVPAVHPLRALRVLLDTAQISRADASTDFPPEPIRRALLLQALLSVPNDLQLREQLEHNQLYRWFVGLQDTDRVWEEATLASAREHLIASRAATSELDSVLTLARRQGLLSADNFHLDEKRLSALTGKRAPSVALFAVFLLSGAAALVYQLVWQRVLFAIYGIDIASVTIVVTAFMLGLGGGGLLGGALSRHAPRSSLSLFACFELGIGAFGLVSLALFDQVASFTLGIGHAGTFLVTFLLVLLPTTLMGATLPLLVAFATRRSGNVGRSVGNLYFVNTLGAAAGAWLAVEFLLGSLGLASSVRWAALLNLALGVVVATLAVRDKRRSAT